MVSYDSSTQNYPTVISVALLFYSVVGCITYTRVAEDGATYVRMSTVV